jgi:glucosyl-dolichyl phosphate glucuronosyltransferase
MPHQWSVLICTHDRAWSLQRTLECLANLECAQSYEVVVVDNRSSDGTEDVVRRFAANTPVPVRYLAEPRAGKSFALNTGLDAIEGDFVAFTDDDAMPDRTWLRELDSTFERFEADWVFGPVIPGWEETPPKWFSSRLNGLFALLDYGERPFVVTARDCEFFGVNAAARLTALRALGPYRTDLGPTSALGGGGEDTDMFDRAFRAGQRIVYAPTVRVTHMIPPQRAHRSFHRRRMLAGREQNYRLVASDTSPVPRICGVPRFHFRLAIEDLAGFARATVSGDSGRAFEHELRFIRFGTILEQAVRARLRTWIGPPRRDAEPR